MNNYKENMHIFDSLLKIQKYRENRKLRKLLMVKKRLNEQKLVSEKLRTKIKNYHSWRTLQEGDLYDGILNKNVLKNDFDKIINNIVFMKSHENDMNIDLQQVKQKVNRLSKTVEKRRGEYNKEAKKTFKLTEIDKMYRKLYKKIEDDLQENYIEESSLMLIRSRRSYYG